MLTNKDWIRCFVAVWVVALGIVYKINVGLMTELADSAMVVAIAVFILNFVFRSVREDTEHQPKIRYLTPYWLGDAIAWQIVVASGLIGAKYGYGFGPWVGAIGGFCVASGVSWLIVCGVREVWGFIDVMLFFASMAPRRRDNDQQTAAQ